MEKPTLKYKRRLNRQRKLFLEEGELLSLPDILQRMKKFYSGRDCIVEKVKKETVVHSVDDFFLDVEAVSAYLIKNRLQKSHIAVVGENSYAWLVAFFAVTCIGAVAVPIDKELTDPEIAKLCKKSDCEAIFFSRSYKKAAEEFCKEKNFLCICLNGDPGENFESFGKLLSEGRKEVLSNGFDSKNFSAKPRDTAAIVFTSGTTGENKGVVLTHANLSSNVHGVLSVIEPVYSAISVLPMNHTYELSCCVLPALCLNAVLYINDSLRHLNRNLSEFKPEAMASVPLLMDNIYESILKKAKEEGKLPSLLKAAKLSEKLLKIGIDPRRPLFASVRKSFGYRFPMMAVGGAPVNAERAKFLSLLGFNIYIGYGLTEASPIVSINSNVLKESESVGKCVSCTECKIVSPDKDGIGEIAIKGTNVSNGYYNDEKATSLSFKDGWFFTGDYGKKDKDGNLFICGRKKNLIILDNGKNIFTEVLEAFFTENSPLIKEAVVLEHTRRAGSESTKLLALAVSVDEELFGEKSDEEMFDEVSNEVYRLNEKLPAYKRIADVMAVRHDFEKTSTAKIIRRKVEEEYKNFTDLRDKSHA